VSLAWSGWRHIQLRSAWRPRITGYRISKPLTVKLGSDLGDENFNRRYRKIIGTSFCQGLLADPNAYTHTYARVTGAMLVTGSLNSALTLRYHLESSVTLRSIITKIINDSEITVSHLGILGLMLYLCVCVDGGRRAAWARNYFQSSGEK
jgi:hypothetical protein